MKIFQLAPFLTRPLVMAVIQRKKTRTIPQNFRLFECLHRTGSGVRAHVPWSSASDRDLFHQRSPGEKIWQRLAGPIKLKIYLEAIPKPTKAPSFKTICKRIKETNKNKVLQPNCSKDFSKLTAFLFL